MDHIVSLMGSVFFKSKRSNKFSSQTKEVYENHFNTIIQSTAVNLPVTIILGAMNYILQCTA